MWRKRLQQIFLIFSIVSFVGSTAYGTVNMFSDALNPKPIDNSKAIAEAKSREAQLQSQERGYELVLKREPDNLVALEGIVQLRMQKKDFQGAIAPMEKLVKLNPNRPDYKALLAQLKQQVAQAEKKDNQVKGSEPLNKK